MNKRPSRKTANVLVSKVHRLIEAGDFLRAERICMGAIRWFKKDARFYRLLGLIHGFCERHSAAQRFWVKAYELGQFDCDLANSVVAFYALGEFESALDLIKIDFGAFSDNAKKIIAVNTEEAVSSGGLNYSDLPFELVVFMKQVKSGLR